MKYPEGTDPVHRRGLRNSQAVKKHVHNRFRRRVDGPGRNQSVQTVEDGADNDARNTCKEK
jgi:hypothetical protein